MNFLLLMLASLMTILGLSVNEFCFRKLSKQNAIRIAIVVLEGLFYAAALVALISEKQALLTLVGGEIALSVLIPIVHFGYRVVSLSRSDLLR